MQAQCTVRVGPALDDIHNDVEISMDSDMEMLMDGVELCKACTTHLLAREKVARRRV